MLWNWENIKKNIAEKRAMEIRPEIVMTALVIVLLFTAVGGVFLFNHSTLETRKTEELALLMAIKRGITLRDELISKLIIENKENPGTHKLLKEYGLTLGEDGKVYYKDGSIMGLEKPKQQ